MYKSAARFQNATPYLESRKSDSKFNLRQAARDRLIDMMASAEFVSKAQIVCRSVLDSSTIPLAVTEILVVVCGHDKLEVVPESLFDKIEHASNKQIDDFLEITAQDYSKYIKCRNLIFKTLRDICINQRPDFIDLPKYDKLKLNPEVLHGNALMMAEHIAAKYRQK